MKNILTLSVTLLFMVTANSQWEKKIKGNGNVVTIERTTSHYDAISVAGWFDVELVDGREGKLKLTGEENLLEYIETEVKNSKLAIKVKKGINLSPSIWKKGVLITLPVESINAITLSGSGDIIGKKEIKSRDFVSSVSGSGDISLTVEAESISTTVSGSGNISLSGQTKQLAIQVSGSGDVKAFELKAEDVTVSVSGSADVQVTATKSLTARISGSGDINYKGNPEKLDTKSSGSGSVSKV